MSKIKLQTAYIPVDVNERLPKMFQQVMVSTNKRNELVSSCIDSSKDWDDYPFTYDEEHPTHWLEKQDNSITLSKELFEKIALSIFNAGQNYQFDFDAPSDVNDAPTFEEYLKSLFE